MHQVVIVSTINAPPPAPQQRGRGGHAALSASENLADAAAIVRAFTEVFFLIVTAVPGGGLFIKQV